MFASEARFSQLHRLLAMSIFSQLKSFDAYAKTLDDFKGKVA
jgi:hypothetical protein